MPGIALPDFTDASATEVVLARTGAGADLRLAELVAAVVRHLHALVRDVRRSPTEWMAALRFLTETGQACTDARQELILLSDVLGVSMLVDAVNDEDGGTESTVLGPFHVAAAPLLPGSATLTRDRPPTGLVSGRVLDAPGQPIAGAWLDVWHAGEDGFYDVQRSDPALEFRGRFRTDEHGRFAFRTVRPAPYPIPTDGPGGRLLAALGRPATRPAHIHFIVEAPGHRPLTTHLFAADDLHLATDPVFGVRAGLVLAFEGPAEDWRLRFDFRLVPAAAGADQAAVVFSAARTETLA